LWHNWPVGAPGFALKARAVLIQATGGQVVRCKSGKGSGSFAGASGATMSLTLLGCEATGPTSGRCASEGASDGEIRSEPLSATLGYLSHPKPQLVGVRISGPGEGPVARFVCGGHAISVSGAALGSFSPLDAMTKKMTFTFSQGGGVPQYERFEE